MDALESFEADVPLIGMVHLPPLPGAPGRASSRDAIRERMVADAAALADGGVDGLLLENYGDAPFYPESVPKHVVADLAVLASTLRDATDLPVGVNVLRNDAEAAVAVAAASGATFVRVNVHVGTVATDQGLLEGQAHETMRLRERIDAPVAVLADVHVKHGTPVGSGSVERAAVDAVERGRADGVIVSGSRTGAETDAEAVARVVDTLDERGSTAPVFVGSGVTAETVGAFADAGAAGVVVGTALKEDGRIENPVSTDRVRRVVDALDDRDG